MGDGEEVSARFHLAREPQAPQRARAIVADVLASAGHEELIDTARLLTTELVTNAVVHAASPPDLEITTDAAGITVTVRDADTGPITRQRPADELVEGGRGILLIDRMAQAWGTEHRAGRKAVWFRLAAAEPATDAEPASTTTRDGQAAVRPAAAVIDRIPAAGPRLAELLLRPLVTTSLGFAEQVAEILERTMSAVGGAGAALVLTDRDAAPITRGTARGNEVITAELVIAERTLGTLTVHASADPGSEARAFVALAAERLALLAAQDGLIHDERSRISHLDYLAEVGDLLAGSLDVTLTLTLAAQIAVPHLAQWCAAYRVDDHGEPTRTALAHVSEDEIDAVSAMLDDHRALASEISDTVSSAALRPLAAVPAPGGQSITIAPLVSRGRTVGALVLGTPSPVSSSSRMLVHDIARRVAVAVDNAMLNERQTATAAALQRSLLPGPLPTSEHLELAARYHAASPGLMVGGDFYDAFALSDGSVALVLGDVCGKGAEAAAITGISRDALRLLMQLGHGPADALRMLNGLLLERSTEGRFCTVVVAVLKGDDHSTSVRLCLAGHPEPAVLHADGTTELVGRPGPLLGVLDGPDLVLHEVNVELAPHDALVLYTDGVTERREGDRMFGTDGMLAALTVVAGQSASAVAQHLEESTRSFVESELRDDIAILVARSRATAR